MPIRRLAFAALLLALPPAAWAAWRGGERTAADPGQPVYCHARDPGAWDGCRGHTLAGVVNDGNAYHAHGPYPSVDPLRQALVRTVLGPEAGQAAMIPDPEPGPSPADWRSAARRAWSRPGSPRRPTSHDTRESYPWSTP